MVMKIATLIIAFIFIPFLLFAQDVGFMNIKIGMSRDEALKAGEENEIIEVPKNRDVDFFPVEERKILTFSAKPDVPYIYLQFFNDTLYSITVIFDEKYIDYYALARQMEQKYGHYQSMSPEWREWRIDSVLIKVEKPSTVKYIALEEFLKAVDFKRGERSSERRNKLLEGL
jgi:hypothetical protein